MWRRFPAPMCTCPPGQGTASTVSRCTGARLGDDVPVIGWVEGPLAEACDLAGVNEILLQLALDPDYVRMLMDRCIVTAGDFARAQIDAGGRHNGRWGRYLLTGVT